MRYHIFWLAAAWSLALVALVWAELPHGGTPVVHGAQGAPASANRTEFIEGWNEWGTPVTDVTYSAPCFGFAYEPSFDYWLNRIEFMAGNVAGEASIEIRADAGTGYPTGPVLASGSYSQVATHQWQGADLDNEIHVEPGVVYYIKYEVVVGGYLSASEHGDLVPHCWSYDCAVWGGPTATFCWMVRFYGGFEPSAAESATWGGVKALYR